MSLRPSSTAAVIAAVMFAGVATASPGEPGSAACSRMLKASLPRPETGAPELRIEFLNEGHVDTEQEYASGVITYDLRAVAADSGRAVAAAACTVNEDGAIVAMLFEPRLWPVPAMAAARSSFR